LEIKEYQEKAARTLANCDSNLEDNIHMALGMCTESAELADVFKKALAYKKEVDWVNVKEEAADCLWYIANLCNINGWDLRDLMQTNIDKLQARYPNKFDTNKAINRDLETERKILEQ
jgi:NTP pyrophosphatase (non-canonical NTP hydrolase)